MYTHGEDECDDGRGERRAQHGRYYHPRRRQNVPHCPRYLQKRGAFQVSMSGFRCLVHDSEARLVQHGRYHHPRRCQNVSHCPCHLQGGEIRVVSTRDKREIRMVGIWLRPHPRIDEEKAVIGAIYVCIRLSR